MAYYVVFLRSGQGFTAPASPTEVRADSYRESGRDLHFFRGEQLVFQAPIVNVRMIERFRYQLEASERITQYNSRKAGAATMHVHEQGYVSARGKASSESAGVVERLSISIVEPSPASRRRKP